MAQHPNVKTIDRMTQAALDGDADTLSQIFTEDMVFHLRGTLPAGWPGVGEHRGVSGFLSVMGSIAESTKGDLKLEQFFAIADDNWAAEWERAIFGSDGRTLELYDCFLYRFEEGRIAEMWMIGAGSPEGAAVTA